ncbi:MAG: hypothetical protein LBV26_05760 [Bacteroidales bacterium]|jgi:hypothetical protein|nr:hypothetical protein [Bacteroidales bacterium]
MNRNDFIAMAGNNEPVSKSALGEIYELVDMFPYCPSAHLLLLKGLNDNEDVRFSRQLKRSALHVANREILYHYLNSHPNRLQGNKENRPQDSDSIENVIILTDDSIEVLENPELITNMVGAAAEKENLLELDADSVELSVHESPNSAITPDENELRKQQQSNLIDRFIITNPRIEPAKDKNIHPAADLSAPYSEETGGLVTETLARIYVNQEYYSKAIIIYEKLSLKYPEKNSYFASQIENIKELIKNR